MYEQYLQHHGILGQKWGVRRYQNKDGTLTSAGKRHEKILDAKSGVKSARSEKNAANKDYKTTLSKAKKARGSWDEAANKAKTLDKKTSSYNTAKKNLKQTKLKMEEEAAAEKGSTVKKERAKKAVKVGAAVAGTALAAYGTYKASQYIKQKAADKAVDRGWNAAHRALDGFGNMALNAATAGKTSQAQLLINAGNEAYERHRDNGFKKAAEVAGSTKEAIKYLYYTKNNKG